MAFDPSWVLASITPTPEFAEFVSLVCIGLSVIGAVALLLLPPEREVQRTRATGVFIFGIAGVVLITLLEKPGLRGDIAIRITLAAIAVVLAFLGRAKRRQE